MTDTREQIELIRIADGSKVKYAELLAAAVTMEKLLDRIHELEQRGCQFDCRAKRKADFVAGFDAGVDDTAASGRILCPDLYKEVVEKLWQERRKGDEAS